MRSFHFPGRSPVYATKAVAATSHPLASATALDVMKRGGNAVDATIAAAAVLAVVEHPMTGIGGDCFAMIAKPGAAPIALNASGRAPAAATAERYRGFGFTSIPMQSPHAVTVPGAIDGWATLLADHGTMGFAELLAPAISYARDGFPVAPRVSVDWTGAVTKLKAHAGAARNLLVDGDRAPRVGERFAMPALARTLEAIARDGRDGFYRGEVAEDIVATLKALGGVHTLEDFAAQKASYVDPISVDYKGVELFELPPNNHGIVALILLKMLARLGKLSDDPTAPERYHVMIEAARLAYAMRDAFVADPAMAEVDVAHMLADRTIDTLVSRIDRRRRTPDLGPVPRPTGSDTIYLSVIDPGGMEVSFINSLFSDFGSGICAERSGVTLHNRGQGFVLDPAHPNCIAPGKRPMHTLVPALTMRDGKPDMAFGVMGAAFQPMGHVYVVTNMEDYGLDPQEALDCSRVFFEGEEVQVEDSLPTAVRERLAAFGHTVGVRPLPWGGGQIVRFDRANGCLVAASDARKDGCAIGF
ncbi:MAG: gamma-glutamyltransferase family protein [Hyphomicrobiaceae bacterium]